MMTVPVLGTQAQDTLEENAVVMASSFGVTEEYWG